uniref:uncharacterized protein LOC122594041 n=1 Tax=Erigeron canadensis TaxID=72917 RepID=UPI001CB8C98F|nr:uncharacterized protein LOC122594041 [Erigeron canadensis]
MAIKVISFVYLFVLMIQISCSSALLNSMPDVNVQYSKSISDLKETIVKGLESQLEGAKVSGFDLKDTLVARSMEFELEIDNKVLPIKLLEDVNKWEHVELPTFLVEDKVRLSDENGLLAKKDKGLPSLAPFQLSGPMELWIQDAKDMRLFLPHDVDAGELKKVILADGAVVTIHGAKSVSLRHPIELPLPFNKTNDGFASGLFTLADHLLNASRSKSQLISLRIVGPASLSSPATSSRSSNRLKLKRLAPGLVKLSAVSKPNSKTALSTIDLQEQTPALFTQEGVNTFWPVSSLNRSNSNLRGIETLISAVLDSTASTSDSFKVLKVDISAQTFLKLGFAVEKKLTGNESFWEGYPEWRTKPENINLHYEVLAKVDGQKLVPEKVLEVDPVIVEDSVAPSVLNKNISMSRMPIIHFPFSPFAL